MTRSRTEPTTAARVGTGPSARPAPRGHRCTQLERRQMPSRSDPARGAAKGWSVRNCLASAAGYRGRMPGEAPTETQLAVRSSAWPPHHHPHHCRHGARRVAKLTSAGGPPRRPDACSRTQGARLDPKPGSLPKELAPHTSRTAGDLGCLARSIPGTPPQACGQRHQNQDAAASARRPDESVLATLARMRGSLAGGTAASIVGFDPPTPHWEGGMPPFSWTAERLVGTVRSGGEDRPPCKGIELPEAVAAGVPA